MVGLIRIELLITHLRINQFDYTRLNSLIQDIWKQVMETMMSHLDCCLCYGISAVQAPSRNRDVEKIQF